MFICVYVKPSCFITKTQMDLYLHSLTLLFSLQNQLVHKKYVGIQLQLVSILNVH